MADAGQLGEDVINEISKGLEAVANGTLDAKGDAQAARQHISAAGDQLLNDPLAALDNIFGAAASAYKAAGKGLANSAAEYLLPDEIKTSVATHTTKLREMGPELRSQLSKLDDETVQNSIGWLLLTLSSAVTLWRKRNVGGQSTVVKPDKTSQAKHTASEGSLGATSRQVPATHAPSAKKNGTCSSTCHSISFSLGSEILSHTDFSLPGPFPVEWSRTYHSRLGAYDYSELGARWITEFTTRFDCVGDGLMFHDADGRSHDYPLPNVGLYHYDAIENLTVIRASADQLLLCRGFERKETYVRHGQRFVLSGVVLRNGAGIMLHYEHRHG
ncbi:hypothetical protein EMIT0P265_250012 [Pseudomonas zeae]